MGFWFERRNAFVINFLPHETFILSNPMQDGFGKSPDTPNMAIAKY